MLGCGESTPNTTLGVDEGGEGTGCTDNGGTASVGSELTASRRSSVLALPQPGTLSSPVDPYGVYDRAIDSTRVCGGTVLREGVQRVADYLAALKPAKPRVSDLPMERSSPREARRAVSSEETCVTHRKRG